MNPSLVDQLTCPRCGPDFGLVLLATEVRDRRVLRGELGCPNCRDGYPIADGFGDLRPPPRTQVPDFSVAAEIRSDLALRVAAGMGVPRGPGTLVMIGGVAAAAPSVVSMIQDIEVVAVLPEARGWPETTGLTRIDARGRLPLRTLAARGAAVAGDVFDAWRGELLRVVAPGARIVVVAPEPNCAEGLTEAGLEIVAADEETVVARVASGPHGVASGS